MPPDPFEMVANVLTSVFKHLVSRAASVISMGSPVAAASRAAYHSAVDASGAARTNKIKLTSSMSFFSCFAISAFSFAVPVAVVLVR
jgi:hypothetical protein